MALIGSELRYARRRVGSLPTDAELNTLHDTLIVEGKVQPTEWVILEVLETRLADLIRNPASFNVSGEYSQSTVENIKALKEQIAGQRAWMEGQGIVLDGVAEGGLTILHATGPDFVR